MNAVQARAIFLRTLMERVREDRYPSATQMTMLEQTLPPQLLPELIEILLEKVVEDHNPSIPMLKRISRLVDAAR
jgi:hypothetical protein